MDFRIDFASELASETDTDVACRKYYGYRREMDKNIHIRIDIDEESLYDQ